MRTSGILMHISSLPSSFGIGTFGQSAYDFVDFLKESGQSYWQILPICPTSYGDSPYQSFSVFAGNPFFIDLDFLSHNNLLSREDYINIDWGTDPETVDYGKVYAQRYGVLRIAYENFIKNIPPYFYEFIALNDYWLEDYALFMALKESEDGRSWLEWDDNIRFRKPETIAKLKEKFSGDIQFWKVIQCLFFQQWNNLKTYANQSGVNIIGDIPIYTAMDSADVWCNPEIFLLDKNLMPIDVAGVPPDSFTADGQLWGNPLFRWDVMEADGYSWWIERLNATAKMYNLIRIDHFRGFDSFYAVKATDPTAKLGEWRQGPGVAFFKEIEKHLEHANFIAEDLGFLTPSVIQLVKDTGYPGMKILQFAFDSRDDNDYLPHNYEKNCVVYTGTHDNNTILGWFDDANEEDVSFAVNYLRLNKEEGYSWGMIKAMWASVADTSVVPMQDLLGLGEWARMNVPSTMGTNWKWRMKPDAISETLTRSIYANIKLYHRLPIE